jgi:hypothetical protein
MIEYVTIISFILAAATAHGQTAAVLTDATQRLIMCPIASVQMVAPLVNTTALAMIAMFA